MYIFHISQDNRSSILSRLSEVQTQKSQLEAELERYRECDPEVIEEVRQETVVAKEAANRWTGLHLSCSSILSTFKNVMF